MNTHDFLHHTRALIAADRLPEALQQIRRLLEGSPLLDEALLQSARYQELHRAVRRGTIDAKQAGAQRNRLRRALLDLLRELEEREDDLKKEVDAALQAQSGESRSGSGEGADKKGDAYHQNAEKIYNIDKIDKADFRIASSITVRFILFFFHQPSLLLSHRTQLCSFVAPSLMKK